MDSLRGTLDLEDLRDRLAASGVTQGMLASHLQIDSSAVSRALSGKRRFSQYEESLVKSFLAQIEGTTDETNRAVETIGAQRSRALRYWMKGMHRDSKELSVLSSISAGRIEGYLRAVGPPMNDDAANALGTALGVDLDAPIPGTPFEVPARAALHSEGDTLVVHAAPTLAQAPFFKWDPKPAGRFWRPSSLLGATAFAVYCPQFGMGARYRAGDVMFVHQGPALPVGADAMVVMANSTMVVGRLLSSSSEGYVVQPAEGETALELDPGIVEDVFRIAGVWFG